MAGHEAIVEFHGQGMMALDDGGQVLGPLKVCLRACAESKDDKSTMALDLKPRLLVHTILGDFAVDPWSGQRLDLSAYGFTGYDVSYDDATSHLVVVLHHRLAGDITLDPFASGPAPDLTAYGITGYEIVFGVPQIAPGQALLGNIGAWLGLGAMIGLAWYVGRRRG